MYRVRTGSTWIGTPTVWRPAAAAVRRAVVGRTDELVEVEVDVLSAHVFGYGSEVPVGVPPVGPATATPSRAPLP